MDTVIQYFRTALFGFNRKDVQQYMEQTASAHREEIARLHERLDLAEERNGELETALSEAQSEKSSAAAEGTKVRVSLEESTRALSKLRGELSQSESKLTVARKELERLKEQVDTLKPMAEGYVQLKERVAVVELDAHRRAQNTVDEAQAEAERIRADTQAWLDGVLARYEQLRQGMSALLAQAQAMVQAAEQVQPLDETAQSLRELSGVKQPRSDT